MESPAIIVAVVLMKRWENGTSPNGNLWQTIKHSLTNGSVLLILGSLLIGYFADAKQAEGIKPFTTDIFKGFLSLFLLEIGMVTARRFGAFKKYGLTMTLFGLIVPLINGITVAYLSQWQIGTISSAHAENASSSSRHVRRFHYRWWQSRINSLSLINVADKRLISL